ncbi:MAG: aminotransferase class I/II-fold pyridoxal phosphate-dependent enzyme [Gemmatimonadota bacterium]|nr:aminotransferase class I/II-fold pyridoxal phosphate-dependent enzyme [Gemmatimonadota bacterium]MDH4349597.1 aminotransferase class I/II-fold pyridoxal phosphate-dependent enzyme [Gemmatimonadota bacterium]MDH5195877.1 aminotransferase class I/II-fold pyridoxal phosphate-dependent enzyme [Gemmatimonadota bacterium]
MPIDLRSDTVTRPSDAMRRAMAEAEVGDDVLDGDPTTGRLEARVAELLGHEAALFFPSGTQANQTGIGVSVARGEELVLEAGAHLLHYEMGALGALWGVQPRLVSAPDGILTGELVEGALRPASPHVPRLGGIAVENTHNSGGGTVTPVATMRGVRAVADRCGVPMHIDGARLWNAAVALRVEPAAVAGIGTTVMVSFSKGLGCPVGSCLAGSRDRMRAARVLRKRLGGGMRQSGVLTAACLYALDHVLPRLGDDHAAAQALAAELQQHPHLDARPPATNIVMIDLQRDTADTAIAKLAEAGVLVVPFGATRLRAVTHLDVTVEQAARAGAVIARTLA